MRIRFLRYAQAELREAIQYYESQVPGLGTDFFLEVTAALDHLADFPIAWRKVDAELRQHRVGKFPYGLIYLVEGDEVLVVAVTHLHRRPRSWRARFREKD